MKESTPQSIRLQDYRPPTYLISDVFLTFELDETQTIVTSILKMERNKKLQTDGGPLVLSGEELKLLEIRINGNNLEKETDYKVESDTLTIFNPGEDFYLEIVNEVNPSANKALEGLYKSGNIFCTQNEAEGFRRITYFLDRPDVMAKYKTKIIADKKEFPTLLSNGNLIESGELDGGKHFTVWEDPFVKPCYLFALVGGNLGLVEDDYTTLTGRKIDLKIYCDPGNEKKCFHAMESLKKSMRWDEETFGLEYDLDIYMIVAVDAFNMGAMENKGLNIFNTNFVLANPKMATDDNFMGIESVVAHEYFHNWTGNRITCRDWFQLTLKEGLTVFRDQEFSSDMNSRAVQRISDVNSLRLRQFVEDAGPTAHPIKPSSYIEINNFYTSTIYEKGAEVIRMIHTLLGKEGFRRGMDKYFELFDGQAVTTEDFIHSMEVANNADLEQFKRWYSQTGTPEIKIDFEFDEKNKELRMDVEQILHPSPGQNEKEAFHFPLKFGLLDKDGNDISLKLKNTNNDQKMLDKGILEIKNLKESFHFEGILERPVPSLNRGFSAPIKLNVATSLEDYCFLLSHDMDEFNRFEAGQQLVTNLALDLISKNQSSEKLVLEDQYIEAFGKLLKDDKIDLLFKASAIMIPAEEILLQEQDTMDFNSTHFVRDFIIKTLASRYQNEFLELYECNHKEEEFSLEVSSVGRRALKNRALGFLVSLETEDIYNLCLKQLNSATNMTDEFSALAFLVSSDNNYKEDSLKSFYKKWKDETQVMQKWLRVQASSSSKDTLDQVLKLEKDAIFDMKVPNLVRALVGVFATNNIHFHDPSGKGYNYLADRIIELDLLNPQVAARLAGGFKHFKKLNLQNAEVMKEALSKIRLHPNISKNVFEIISKIMD